MLAFWVLRNPVATSTSSQMGNMLFISFKFQFSLPLSFIPFLSFSLWPSSSFDAWFLSFYFVHICSKNADTNHCNRVAGLLYARTVVLMSILRKVWIMANISSQLNAIHCHRYEMDDVQNVSLKWVWIHPTRYVAISIWKRTANHHMDEALSPMPT